MEQLALLDRVGRQLGGADSGALQCGALALCSMPLFALGFLFFLVGRFPLVSLYIISASSFSLPIAPLRDLRCRHSSCCRCRCKERLEGLHFDLLLRGGLGRRFGVVPCEHLRSLVLSLELRLLSKLPRLFQRLQARLPLQAHRSLLLEVRKRVMLGQAWLTLGTSAMRDPHLHIPKLSSGCLHQAPPRLLFTSLQHRSRHITHLDRGFLPPP
mmetsp:Transcript_7141/g.17237  ORF Transcript_7141/g.17237 Transcript_7141/m.17237 type:complete len:213 (-) Transcript_7141:803-1441(-)